MPFRPDAVHAAVTDAELRDALTTATKEDRSTAEHLTRLEGDRAVVEALQASGYDGKEWRYFQDVLASYGLAVIRAWLRDRTIFDQCARKGFGGLAPPPQQAFDDPDTVLELAMETVAVALESFRRTVLIPGRWDHRKGASVRTFSRRFYAATMGSADGPELVIGLVTPIGTNTAALAESVTGALSAFGYTPILIKMSELIPDSGAPIGEFEDDRVRRLIAAGDAFCQEHVSPGHEDGDPAALARLAVREIQRRRLLLKRQDGADPSPQDIVDQVAGERPRTAYILHSLKRPIEVQLLRRIYGEQFFLIGSQTTVQQREDSLLRRTLPPGTDAERRAIAQDLIRLDADERSPIGQKVNDTYPLADFFLREADASRVIALIFGETIPPTVDEYAMYVARASRARSLAASRKVGAAIVVGDAVVATGYNDVPHGQKTDVLAGVDTSERLKQDNVLDTVRRLRQNGLLNDDTNELGDDDLTQRALEALKGGELLGVIEYQRAVHAEARAIDDATMRGVSPVGGTLYVTTYPCHLCYKHALSVRLASIQYIEPYPKSRAVAMYPTEREDQLVPYAGVAPRRYVQVFDDRPAPVSDPSGTFINTERSVAIPLLGAVRNDADRDFEERLAVAGLKEQYQ